jgi:hypothetical protein
MNCAKRRDGQFTLQETADWMAKILREHGIGANVAGEYARRGLQEDIDRGLYEPTSKGEEHGR